MEKAVALDPRANQNKSWKLEDLLNYEPVVEALRGEDTLTNIAGRYVGVTQPHLSRLLGYVEKHDPNLLPEKMRRRAKRAKHGSKVVNTYPIYGKVQAGVFNRAHPQYHDTEDQGWYCTQRALPEGERTPFALKVDGASMTDHAAAASFPEGSIVLVNPNVAAVHGDFVVVMNTEDGSTTLKRLHRQAEQVLLVPLNPQFQPIPVDSPAYEIVGVVEEARLPLYARH